MRGLQVVEADIYPYKNKNDREKIMRELGLKRNEVTLKNNLIIVTKERIEVNKKRLHRAANN